MPLCRERPVTKGVDTTVEAAQPPHGRPFLDGPRAQAELPQLADARHGVLCLRELRQPLLERGLSKKANLRCAFFDNPPHGPQRARSGVTAALRV